MIIVANETTNTKKSIKISALYSKSKQRKAKGMHTKQLKTAINNAKKNRFIASPAFIYPISFFLIFFSVLSTLPFS